MQLLEHRAGNIHGSPLGFVIRPKPIDPSLQLRHWPSSFPRGGVSQSQDAPGSPDKFLRTPSSKRLFDIGEKAFAVDRAIEPERGRDANDDEARR
jgi:hypothetical protein